MFANVADLRDIGFDELEPIPLDMPIQSSQLIFDAFRSGSDPLQFKMKDVGRIVDDIMVQDHRFRLVTPLVKKRGQRLSESRTFNKVQTLFVSISMTIVWLRISPFLGRRPPEVLGFLEVKGVLKPSFLNQYFGVKCTAYSPVNR